VGPVFSYDDGGYFFYEYEFSKQQMRGFLSQTGFEIVQEFVGIWKRRNSAQLWASRSIME